MNFTPSEAAWLHARLTDLGRKIPSARTFLPWYDAGSWDLRELFRAFRQDAIASREQAAQAVRARTTTGAWPRMTTAQAFWLRARWGMALRHCQRDARQQTHSATGPHATPPTDAQAAIEWLVLDLWDEQSVDAWIRENARDHIDVADPSLTSSIIALEAYLDRLERS